MKNFKVVVQARMGSSRLKNKMTMNFYEDYTLFETIIKNLLIDFEPSQIVVATSKLPENKVIGEYANRLGVDVYYGSEDDVLSRFIDVSDKYGLDFVIRVCADNPFIQNKEIFKLIGEYENHYDYIGFFYSDNTPSIQTHSGFFTELVKTSALKRVKDLTSNIIYREHVTNFIYKNENLFNIKKINIDNEDDIRKIRLTIDDEKDFKISKKIYNRWIKNKNLNVTDLVNSSEKKEMSEQIINNKK